MVGRLKQIRRELGFTCQQMAEKMNLTKATYSKKENGKISISLTDAGKISNILGRSVDDIFFTSDNRADADD